jgi:hypothetical protein
MLASGRTPGSPQLNSFGPNTDLAQALLEAGDRKAVLQYLELCRRFWAHGETTLDRWATDIEAGRAPDFDRRY